MCRNSERIVKVYPSQTTPSLNLTDFIGFYGYAHKRVKKCPKKMQMIGYQLKNCAEGVQFYKAVLTRNHCLSSNRRSSCKPSPPPSDSAASCVIPAPSSSTVPATATATDEGECGLTRPGVRGAPRSCGDRCRLSPPMCNRGDTGAQRISWAATTAPSAPHSTCRRACRCSPSTVRLRATPAPPRRRQFLASLVSLSLLVS